MARQVVTPASIGQTIRLTIADAEAPSGARTVDARVTKIKGDNVIDAQYTAPGGDVSVADCIHNYASTKPAPGTWAHKGAH